MQSDEFNKMMNGQPAKWMEMSEPLKVDFKSSVPVSKQIDIENNQTDIPPEKMEEIQAFIKLLQDLKVKKMEIRWRVKNRFNINVI